MAVGSVILSSVPLYIGDGSLTIQRDFALFDTSSITSTGAIGSSFVRFSENGECGQYGMNGKCNWYNVKECDHLPCTKS